MPSRKETLVAATRSRPRNRPAEIVAPDREMPGISARHWTRPITRASTKLSFSSGRLLVPRRSAATITNDQPISAAATHHRLRSGPEMTSRARNPTMTIGTEPTITYQPIRWSNSPRCSGLTRPRTQATAIRRMSFQKNRTTAAIAPTWITAVKPVIAGSSICRPSIFDTMVRWPVLDTGRNSVRPSTMPRMMASQIVISDRLRRGRAPRRPCAGRRSAGRRWTRTA